MVQHPGPAAELLDQEGDGPGADHPVAQMRVDRLQQIVPVAFAVAQQPRAEDEPLLHHRDDAVDMGRDRVAALGAGEILLVAPGHRLVQEGHVARGLDVVAQRLQRPDDDVAMGVPVLDRRVGLEHEPLRPVAPALVLLGEDGAQHLLRRGVVLQRQQELQRALADVAGAPGAAGVLLQPVRHGQVDHRVMRQPGKAASSAAPSDPPPVTRRPRVASAQWALAEPSISSKDTPAA